MSSIRIITGDSLTTLPSLSPDSFDSCVTDPPYGIGFMGRAWDHGVPGEAYWAEVLRVLKPGGWLVAFGGTRSYHRLTCAIEDAGFEVRDCLMWLYGSGFPKGKGCLKPGWEPITLARKPGGTPWLNIDGCRIATEDDLNGGAYTTEKHKVGRIYGKLDYPTKPFAQPSGRWPANVVLDGEAARLLDEQSGERSVSGSAKNGRPATGEYAGGFGGFAGKHQGPLYNDAGGASRFFYCAKASTKERGEGNTHPTVKPRKLMDWLVRLVTPPDGRILDPFVGSGTTLLACLDGGFKGTGIDNDPESVRIAYGRLRAHQAV